MTASQRELPSRLAGGETASILGEEVFTALLCVANVCECR